MELLDIYLDKNTKKYLGKSIFTSVKYCHIFYHIKTNVQ